MPDTVLVTDYHYRDSSGQMRVQRWVGSRCIGDDECPCVILDWWRIEAVWMTLMNRPTAMIKEGPKALLRIR